MNNPFRYFPCPEIVDAADNLIRKIDSDPYLHSLFCEGKMMGVLWVKNNLGEKSFLYAFSGNVQGLNVIDGFVPPIFDLLDKDGYFKTEEARISAIDKKAKALKSSQEYKDIILKLESSKQNYSLRIEEARADLAIKKDIRNRKRLEAQTFNDNDRLIIEDALVKESQFEKAELHRLKKALKAEIDQIQSELDRINAEIQILQKEAAERSFALQEWIFHQFIVHNALGQKKSIWEIFQDKGIVPPGGTGECAGPKLLEYAYKNNLKPLAMGEFWYGKTQGEELREHGKFYPSCQPKCGTLLPFMLEGLDIDKEIRDCNYSIVFEDDSIIVVDKPSGLLSVPGKDGNISLKELLDKQFEKEVYPVHRLDMDTSGIIVFAKNQSVQSTLQREFEKRETKKCYRAILDNEGKPVKEGDHGTISLPIRADYELRPRQVVDKINGKESITDYEIKEILEDGRIVVELTPHTGRTHQLRVHCTHPEGLGHAISGDRLYGSTFDCKLRLRAYKLTFKHPKSGKEITIQLD